MSWAERAKGHTDKYAVRAKLNLEQVVTHELGVKFDEYGKAPCPFHDDRDPSFAVFENDDGTERCGCWSCEWRGDVFDVIMEARTVSFGDAVNIAAGLVDSLPPVERRERDERVVPAAEMRVQALRAYEYAREDSTPINRFLVGKGLRMSARWLTREFMVGVRAVAGDGTILIPHFDADLNINGFKVRSVRTPTIAARGSRLSEMYGVWRDAGHQRVAVMEGETDTWSAAWLAEDMDVFGLPTGTQSPIRSHWLDRLSGRDVRIIFDPDKPGVDAASRWEEMLGDATVIDLPDGNDFTKQPLANQKKFLDTI